MSKKIIWSVVGIIVLVGVFFGGAAYGKGQAATAKTTGASAYAGLRGTRGGFGGATIGQIISEDATSITVQLMAPNTGTTGTTTTTPVGSKIVFLDGNTKITKEVNGTMSDLPVGTNVSVTGTANTDGSISAQAIQIRPNMPAAATSAPNVVQ